ncbi:uncharacterized protein LOC143785076 [Ranitomeya variabilis]|uniref:uncharacterized protein LOC143785076 n=1 Tax=Ranitomeya variabilis TaxID=490064 RepID=UPI004056B080
MKRMRSGSKALGRRLNPLQGTVDPPSPSVVLSAAAPLRCALGSGPPPLCSRRRPPSAVLSAAAPLRCALGSGPPPLCSRQRPPSVVLSAAATLRCALGSAAVSRAPGRLLPITALFPLQGGRSCPVSPLHSGEQPTLDAQDPEARSQKLRDKLQSVASPPPASMSRSARMLLLSAAKSRKRRPPITAVPSPSIPPCGDRGSQQGDSPVSSGSCPETPMTRLHPSKKEHETPNCRLKMEEARRRKRAQTRTSERHRTPRRA